MRPMALLAQEEMQSSLPQQGTTNFFYSFSFLPKEEREAIHSVYAFCRYTDELVDSDPATTSDAIQRKRERLSWWRQELDRCYNSVPEHPVLRRLQPVVQRFPIPKQYLDILIDGCERDISQNRYTTFDDLKEYCFSVASAVGLVTIEIFGYKYEETKEYAINLGYALQLTNIIRDVGKDGAMGRIYIPLEDLERFRYTEKDLLNKCYDERFIELMSYQARRARSYYHKARTALRPDESNSMFAAQVMDAIYYRLLEKIELQRFNVFSKKISVSTLHKILIALRLWTKLKVLNKQS